MNAPATIPADFYAIRNTVVDRFVADAALTGTTYTGDHRTARRYPTREAAQRDCQQNEVVCPRAFKA